MRIDLNQGEIGYSIKELSRQWIWSETKTRRFLKELADDGMVTLKKTNVSCTITLNNYEMWQSNEWQMRRGNDSVNGAQSDEQMMRKRYPNNKDKKIRRIKENKSIVKATGKNRKVTRYCPNRHGSMEVLDKDLHKGVFCGKCGEQVVHESELVNTNLVPF